MSDNMVVKAKTNQPQIFKQFMKLVAKNELSHAYLLTGEEGAGQFDVAMGVAMRLFCTNVTSDGFPCGKCAECERIMNRDHPDVIITEPSGLSIKVDQIRHVKSEFTKSAVEGSQKVFIISDADKMTTGAANSLLKFIEEPTGNVVSFLISQNRNLVLPTIVSRTQVVEFPSISKDLMIQQLREAGVLPSQINLLLSMTNSRSEIMQWLADDWFTSLQKAVSKWFTYLVKRDSAAMPYIQMAIMPLVTNRDRQRVILSMMVSIFDETLKAKYGTLQKADVKFPESQAEIQQAANKWTSDQLMGALDELLNTFRSMAVNVSFQNILESTTLRILGMVES